MYFRRLRTLVNDLLAPGRIEAVYDAEARPRPVRRRRSTTRPGPTRAIRSSYATYRSRLFTGIQARRDTFASDARVPGNQPAAPNIVIDEIQHSPAGG